MSASSGHRILCLHGSGGSGDAFLARLAHLQEGTARSFHAIDAPSGRRTWWTYPAGERSFTASSYEGAEQSIAAVEAELESGGYVGLLGFSQGAMLAAIVAARASLRESCPLLRFAVICAAAVPKPYEPLLERLRAAPEAAAALPTLHCLSEVDSINPPELGEAVAACFTHPASATLWHGGGHDVPPPRLAAEVLAWMDKAVVADAR